LKACEVSSVWDQGLALLAFKQSPSEILRGWDFCGISAGFHGISVGNWWEMIGKHGKHAGTT